MSEEDPQQSRGVLARVRRAFTQNVHLKAIALLLTFALYLWVGADTVTRVVVVPFELSVPADQVLLEPKLDQVKVTVEGRSSVVDRFKERQDKAVRVELSKSQDGQMLAIPHKSLDTPAGLRVVEIEPSFIRVDMAEKQKKEVPIRPRIAGEQDPSYQVGNVTVSPETVVVQGPRDAIEQLDSVPTQPIDVSDREESFVTDVQLRPKSPLIRYELDAPVEVSVTIEVEKLERTVEEVEIRPVNTTYTVRVNPGSVDVVVRGPRGAVESLDSEELFAVVDLSDEDDKPPGTFEKSLGVRNLPSNVEAVRTKPETVVTTTRRRPGTGSEQTEDAGGAPPPDGD